MEILLETQEFSAEYLVPDKRRFPGARNDPGKLPRASEIQLRGRDLPAFSRNISPGRM